jgi:hypothetical protein
MNSGRRRSFSMTRNWLKTPDNQIALAMNGFGSGGGILLRWLNGTAVRSTVQGPQV